MELVLICVLLGLDPIEQHMPPPTCIQAILDQGDGRRIGVGYDEGSRSWYRYQDGKVTAWLPGQGPMAGSAVPGGLQPTEIGPISDAFVDQLTFPHVLVRTLLTSAECESEVQEQSEGGWTIHFRAPWGNPRLCGSRPDAEFEILAVIGPDGVVRELQQLGERKSTTKLRHLGSSGAYPITCIEHEHVQFKFLSAALAPVGEPGVARWTVSQVEQIAIDLRALDTAKAMENAGVRRGPRASPVVPDAAAPPTLDSEPSGPSPVSASSGLKWRNGILLMGVTMLLLGGIAWWRRSRTGV